MEFQILNQFLPFKKGLLLFSFFKKKKRLLYYVENRLEARRAVRALLQSFRREGMSVQTSVLAVEVVRSGQILDILRNIGFPDILYVESI